jgi:glycosyltransferase involved in cell wall biosynthesis
MAEGPQKVGYVVVEFPKVTETFILREMTELLALGVEVTLFSLKTIRNYPVQHQETKVMQERTYYSAFFLSLPLVAANLSFLVRTPWRYLSLWFYLVRHTCRSARFLVKTTALLPKCVYFADVARKLGLERIHAHFAKQPAVCGIIINWLTGIPFSMTPHAQDIFTDTVMLDEKLRRADMVVAISDLNRRYFLEICPDIDPGKIRGVRYGLRLEEYQPKTDYRIDGPVKILSVASLQRYKGIPFLIEACRILAEGGIDFECSVIGEGEDRADLEARIAAAGIGDRFFLPGILPHHEVKERFLRSDIFVLPSIIEENGKMEGLPNALIESLALGVPAVSTNTAGIPELIIDGKTGLLVEQQDSAALAGAMTRLIADQGLREAVAARGREEVLREHDIHVNVRKQLGFFGECQAGRSGRGPAGRTPLWPSS